MSNKTLYIIAVVILVLAAGFFAMRWYSPQEQREVASKTDDAKQEQKIPETQSSMQTPTSSPETAKAPENKVIAEITVKNFGTMKLELDPVAAPKTVANFVKLANQGFYNGLTFPSHC